MQEFCASSCVSRYRDREKLDKIVASLNLKVNDRDLKHTDPKVTLQAVCSQWLPLATAVMGRYYLVFTLLSFDWWM
jgi:hypothetical protein